jgi:hypothetical protein
LGMLNAATPGSFSEAAQNTGRPRQRCVAPAGREEARGGCLTSAGAWRAQRRRRTIAVPAMASKPSVAGSGT